MKCNYLVLIKLIMTVNSGSVYQSQMKGCPRMIPVNIHLSPGLVMLDFYFHHGQKRNCSQKGELPAIDEM